MKHKTPVSELAETLGIDTGAMNQADRQDAVCKAAQERIQRLERFNVGLADENRVQSERIEELEAHVERLRCALVVLTHQCKRVDNWPSFPSRWIESAEKSLAETPAQSLQAVKREAVEEFELHCRQRADAYKRSPAIERKCQVASEMAFGFIEQRYGNNHAKPHKQD